MLEQKNVTVKAGSSFQTICPFPVGYIYQSYNSTSPANIYGGSWSALNNQFLLSSNGDINTTGGEWNHTLTAREIPYHEHNFAINIQHSDGETASGEALTSHLQLGGRRRYFGVTHTTDDFIWGGGTQQYAALYHLPYLEKNSLSLFLWKEV